MAGRGRPSKFNQETADEICRRIAQGESLREVCRDEHMPSQAAVRGWVVDDREGFAGQYARACEQRTWLWAEELIEIVDDGSNDWMERQGKNGETYTTVDSEAVQRSKLRADTRKWLLSKLLPQYFGDKTQVEHTGRVTVSDDAMDPADWAKQYTQPGESDELH